MADVILNIAGVVLGLLFFGGLAMLVMAIDGFSPNTNLTPKQAEERDARFNAAYEAWQAECQELDRRSDEHEARHPGSERYSYPSFSYRD